MSQTPLLGTGALPSIPITSTSIGIVPPSPLTGTTVQEIIDELATLIGSGSVTVQELDGSPSVVASQINLPNGSLSVVGTTAGLHLLTSRGGEQGETQTITASGAAQTLDLSLYNTFDITLTANCTLTFSNPPPSGVDAHWTIILRQGGAGSFTVTWPGTVDWQDTDGTTGGSAPTLWTAVGAQNAIDISTLDGGTTYGGTAGALPFVLTVKDEGTPLATAATSLDFAGAGVVASGTGAAKTITISGVPTGSAGGDLSGTYPNPTVATIGGVAAADIATAIDAPRHVHVVSEDHLSDGSTGLYTLDEYFLDGSVIAWNVTSLARLTVTETAPDQATVSPVGTAGDTIIFDYAALL